MSKSHSFFMLADKVQLGNWVTKSDKHSRWYDFINHSTADITKNANASLQFMRTERHLQSKPFISLYKTKVDAENAAKNNALPQKCPTGESAIVFQSPVVEIVVHDEKLEEIKDAQSNNPSTLKLANNPANYLIRHVSLPCSIPPTQESKYELKTIEQIQNQFKQCYSSTPHWRHHRSLAAEIDKTLAQKNPSDAVDYLTAKRKALIDSFCNTSSTFYRYGLEDLLNGDFMKLLEQAINILLDDLAFSKSQVIVMPARS